jgi:ribosomal protein S18 acetylase RimI-like enzyme
MGEQRIGRMLHDEVVRMGQSQGADCIFLHAANESVAGVYTEWGYKKKMQDK